MLNPTVKSKTVNFPSTLSTEAELVRSALIERGLETPLIENGYTREQKYTIIRDAFTDITTALGLDLADDSLCETPHRIAKMYIDEIFSGLDYGQFPKISIILKQARINIGNI